MTGVGANVDVDEALPRRTLYEGAAESCHAVRDSFFERRLEFEDEVLTFRVLPLDGLENSATTFLQSEINAGWRLLDDNSKGEFTAHMCQFTLERRAVRGGIQIICSA